MKEVYDDDGDTDNDDDDADDKQQLRSAYDKCLCGQLHTR